MSDFIRLQELYADRELRARLFKKYRNTVDSFCKKTIFDERVYALGLKEMDKKIKGIKKGVF